jgi:TRAP-type C4-dicarboxylate transport system substrate-binding protein
VHKFHHFHTITNHFYISRPIFLHRPAYESWPQDLQRAMREAVSRAVEFQRAQAIAEDREARAAIEQQGCEITTLTASEHDAFRAAVAPLLDAAQATFGRAMFDRLGA